MLSLVAKENFSVTGDSVIEKAANFPMWKITERYAAEEGISLEAAQGHETELKRYLTLCALDPVAHYGMNGPVDKLWHTFICFTRDYHDFCWLVAGRYLHHQPTNEEDKKNGKSRQDYLRFLADYEKYFSEPAPVHIWPRLHLLDPKDPRFPNEQAGCGNDPCGCGPGCNGTNCNNG